MGVKPIQEDAVEIRRVSMRVATPVNAVPGNRDTFIAYNRFSRPVFDPSTLPVSREGAYANEPSFTAPGSYNPYYAEGEVGDDKVRAQKRVIRYQS